MPLTAAQQRARHLATRACGNCGRPATAMRPWGAGRKIPVCSLCGGQLDDAFRQVEDLKLDIQWEREREHEPELGYDPYAEE